MRLRLYLSYFFDDPIQLTSKVSAGMGNPWNGKSRLCPTWRDRVTPAIPYFSMQHSHSALPLNNVAS